MYQLVADQGNTRCKFGLFTNTQLVDRITDDAFPNVDMFWQWIGTRVPSRILFASVSTNTLWKERLTDRFGDILSFEPNMPLPFSMTYSTPGSLGTDRKANMAAAFKEVGNKAVLVIDCGTCMTYTLGENQVLLGGAIAPGLDMRYKSLQHFTGKLPLVVHQAQWQEMIGNSTEESILTGVGRGIILETEAMIKQYCSLFPDLTVFITGGAMTFFVQHLKSPIFARPYFTLQGLNEILQYQYR
jgi:type III pantothenate kinase